jgi:hypothetical protein
MAGGVDEEQSGQVEVPGIDQPSGDVRDDVEWNCGRPDVLGDRAGLALAHRGAPHRVQERRLAVVDVPQHGHDGGPERASVGRSFARIVIRHE